ncbi:hypothetical protein [Anaeromyxobacter sp. PSR-1]|uniref:hypothetical protein n=1 Tax=Anaeromyxobacter sp. PSR-1 TaxID=1300915 RepID=UPI0005DD7F14|nr:hypothetical protein [Anaeromyxobacter sp. PSR-1]GAO05133.1 hypothetical protein PSR1_04041 [Anaeromyxobacter sp. PSR-1]
MKNLLAALAVTTLMALGTGCAVQLPVQRRSVQSVQPAAASKKCPPGHQWSDGTCHDTGKGRDRGRR